MIFAPGAPPGSATDWGEGMDAVEFNSIVSNNYHS